MARITLASQGLVIEALRIELAQAQATITALRSTAPSVKPVRPAYAPTPAQLAFRENLAAAKAEAARTGRYAPVAL